MSHIINDKDYIKKQKIRYGLYTFIYLVIMFTGYLLGKYVFVSCGRYLILVSVLFSIVVAQNAVKFIMFLPYKDSKNEIYNKLEGLSDSFYLMNGIILTDGKYKAFFEHVIVGNKKVYFIILKDKDKVEKYKKIVNNIFKKKGFDFATKFLVGKKEVEELVNKLKLHKATDNTKQQIELVQSLKNYSF